MPTTTDTLRDAFVAARRAHSLVEMAGQPVPAGFDEALGVQAAVARELRQQQAGWKVMIAPDGTALAGLMAGPYLAPGDAYVGAADSPLLVEIELCLRLSGDLPYRPDQPWTRAQLLDRCDSVFLGIEIVESRLANWTGVPLPLWVADAVGHGGYVIGPDLDASILDDYAGHGCFVSLDGETLYEKPAVHNNGDPLVPVLAWANRRREAFFDLRAGQIVTTGSLCGGVLAPGKGEIITKLGSLAQVQLTLR